MVETKKEILDHIKNIGFNLFLGETELKNKVTWDNDYEWKEFLEIAEKEGVKTLIFSNLIFDDKVTEFESEIEDFISQVEISNEEIDQLVKQLEELKMELSMFKNQVGELMGLEISWIKEGICYTFQIIANWFDDFLELENRFREIMVFPKEDPIEQAKKSITETKKNLTELSSEIVDWAKSEKMTKMTRSEIQMYLLEKETVLTWDNKETLRAMVNNKLKQIQN